MITKNKRVKHKNPEIDKEKGIMIVRAIKGNYAICGYNDFDRIHQISTFLINELIEVKS